MMKFIKWLVIILVVLVLAFVVVGLMLPSKYEVVRSVTINAPQEKVHAVIGDLNQWPKWANWWRTYPGMTQTMSGNGTDVGSKMTWTEPSIGNGAMEVLKNDPATGFYTEVTFWKEGQEEKHRMNGDLLYAADGNGTKVTWKAYGDTGGNLIGNWMATFFDGMMGPDFEKGLANAKELIEKDGKKPDETPKA